MASLSDRGAADGVEVTPNGDPTGPVVAAAVYKDSWPLGFVWATGDRAGYVARPVGSDDYADAVEYAWMVIDRVGPDVVIAKSRFEPLYALGEAKEYASIDEAFEALLDMSEYMTAVGDSSVHDDLVYRSRVRGCLLGGAVGDALGAPIEFKGAVASRNRQTCSTRAR